MIITLLFIIFILLFFGVRIDIFKDYRNKWHIIVWYTFKNNRKYFIVYEQI